MNSLGILAKSVGIFLGEKKLNKKNKKQKIQKKTRDPIAQLKIFWLAQKKMKKKIKPKVYEYS